MTTLTSPIDLLAAVPFLIGFQPESSIVLIGLRESSIEVAMRVDFPNEADPELNAKLSSHLRDNAIESALLVSYIPDSPSEVDLVIKTLSEAIESVGVEIRESLIVVGDRWRSLICDDTECCPEEGQPLPDLSTSRITAEQISLGNPLPFKDESMMVESLLPMSLDPEVDDEITRCLEFSKNMTTGEIQKQGAESFLDLVSDFQADGICRDKKLIALVLVRLHDLQVRDFALGTVSEEKLHLYSDFFKWLLKSAPKGYVAPAATLFAAVSYERGDGAIAHRAINRALEDLPNYSLALLLRQVFTTGRNPEFFRVMRAELHPKVCDAIFSGSMSA
jgi:hypothetical protein